MPMTPLTIGTALASLAPFFEYFRPTRSPYLLVVVFSILGIILLNYLFDLAPDIYYYWYPLAIPIFIVVLILNIFVFLHKERQEDSEEEIQLADQHLKFSRSICISAAVICMVVGCWYAADITNTLFVIHYISCMCQIVVFTIYTAARLRKQEPAGQLNHFQVALVTSLYLIVMTVCIRYISFVVNDECGDIGTTTIFEICIRYDERIEDSKNREALELLEYREILQIVPSYYLVTYIVFLLLWIWCQYYWITRLRQMISISVRDTA